MSKMLLPRYKWLKSHGYGGLWQATQKYPEPFAHIPREDTGFRTVKQWVRFAEELASHNEGMLPPKAHLPGGLLGAIENHRQLFAHIRRPGDSKKSVREWVLYAEHLAAQHDGILPGSQKLPAGLVSCIYTNTRAFAHIQRAGDRFKSLDHWVQVAEKTSTSNGGYLPPLLKLPSGLVNALRVHKGRFAHIRRKPRRSPTQWVAVAKALAQKNGGVLPPCSQLPSSLITAMVNHKHLFQDIRRPKHRRKSPQEWAAIAHKLAKENRGVLPAITTLPFGMRGAIQRCPGLFSKIPRYRSGVRKRPGRAIGRLAA